MEIWKDIKDLDGYQVSNFGNVRSLNYRRTGKIKVLSLIKNKDGYLRVGLFKDGKQKFFMVHRLVAEAFLPNPNNLPQVNHKDEDKTNNFCGTPENDFNDGNLEWCDSKYNSNYGTRNKRMTKKLSKPVLQFSKTGIIIREWFSTMEAGRNGFNSSHIASCCRGERKTHKGFMWKYKKEVV